MYACLSQAECTCADAFRGGRLRVTHLEHVGQFPRLTRSHSHVGNTMASFVMQSLGCDVSALNTVQFSQ